MPLSQYHIKVKNNHYYFDVKLARCNFDKSVNAVKKKGK